MSNIDGKLTLAPCGHEGRVVIGTYVECLRKCHKDTPAPVKAPNNSIRAAAKAITISLNGSNPWAFGNPLPVLAQPHPVHPNPGSAAHFEQIALAFPIIKKVNIYNSLTVGHFHVDVTCDPTHPPGQVQAVAEAIRDEITKYKVAGTTFEVTVYSANSFNVLIPPVKG